MAEFLPSKLQWPDNFLLAPDFDSQVHSSHQSSVQDEANTYRNGERVLRAVLQYPLTTF